MKNFKEILKKIRDTYNEAMAAPAPAETKSLTLQDGVTVITVDKMEVGGVITPTPSVEGSVTLQDGTVIAHDATGVITSVTPKVEEPKNPDTVEPTLEMSVQTPLQMREFLEKFAAAPVPEGTPTPDLQKMAIVLKAVFEQAFGWELRQAKEKEARDSAIAVYQQGFKAQEEAIKSLLDVVEQFSEQGVAPSVVAEKVDKKFEDMTPLERYRATKKTDS